MTAQKLPSPELLRKLLRYEPETGKLFWQPRSIDMFKTNNAYKSWSARFANKEALTCLNTSGYKTGTINGITRILAHRVIWAMQTGAWPKDQIDHKDVNKLNNSWKNLREASKCENNRNRKSRVNSTSVYVGVHWSKQMQKWHAQIKQDNKKTHLGFFNCEQDAAKAYDAAAKKIHGEFASLNFR